MDVFVLSVNKSAGREMVAHLKEHGFGEVAVVEGVRPRTTKPTLRELHECICAGHHKCTEKYAKEGKHSRFVVVEDDCRFTVPNAYPKIREAVDFLDAHKKWGSLHVGHIPLGAVFPVQGAPFLCHTLNPYSAHCYVLNGDTAKQLLAKIPKSKWKRPHMVEGLKQIPLWERFSFFPSIAIQNNNPKEMRRIVGNAVSYKTMAGVMEGLAVALTGTGFVLLVLAICILVFWVVGSLKSKRKGGGDGGVKEPAE